MKRKYIIFILILAVMGTWGSCKSDFLTVAPTGSLDQTILQSTKGLDALLIGAYSMIDGVSSQFGNGWETTGSNWVYGSIRGMEANKGTDGGDQPDINPLQTFSETATNPYLNLKWREVYEAISRCNSLIIVADKALASGKVAQDAHDLYVKQAKTLRGWYHFEAWRMWGGKVPYIDETVTDPGKATNTADIGPQVIADLSVGLDLPNNMGAIGKFNGTVVKVLVAKALMQINHDYAGALTLLQSAKTGTKPNGAAIGLAPTYGENFDIANRNGIESVYTVQYSVNDGSGAWNSSTGEVLNFPYKSGASPGGCCGFFDPTQEFVNSFRTSGGLPLLDYSYNLDPVKNDQGIALGAAYTPDAKPLDPRLDWSVGRRGIPYWDWGLHTGSDWIRDQTYSGPFSPKKAVYKKSQTDQYTDHSSWTSGYTANGYRMIRFADVLLMIAECQIETGDLAGALANVNLVRARAANAAGWVKMPDGTNAGNYQISLYPSFPDKTYAQNALRMERKLELGQEGHRWFDLNRWGITKTELTRILTYEKTMPWGTSLYGNATVGDNVVKFPIPQRQIDLSNGKLTQN
jgi:starch-binding outer membrane protein, SusD/RagB family